eukprot:GFKZ01001993.1.p1 GENE.GFKZ01001993.1~~GFKZ01001993.1.p1  ORF type:complete len:525 (+),score=70.75 GFKZ01001993.1:135-1709(+)
MGLPSGNSRTHRGGRSTRPPIAAPSEASLSSSVDGSHTPTASPTQTSASDPDDPSFPTVRVSHLPKSPVASTPAFADPVHYVSPKPVVPPGLFNLGNTCYLNSVVQVLYHMPRFREGLLSCEALHHKPHVHGGEVSFACRVVYALKEVFEALQAAERRANGNRDEVVVDGEGDDATDDIPREGIDYIAPQAMVSLLRNQDLGAEFDARGQQDAHEFLRFLLDKVSDCMQMEKGAAENDNKFEAANGDFSKPASAVQAPISIASEQDGGKEPAIKKRRCEKDVVVERRGNKEKPGVDRPLNGKRREGSAERVGRKRGRSNLVLDLFQGRAVTATRCYECECQSQRSEEFLDVSLPVEAGKCLSWALSTQCVEEQLVDRNKYFCGNCKTYTEAKRWWQVATLPDVLTVHLKLFAYGARLSGGGGKVPVAMACPMRTKLAEWCSTKCEEREDEYQLTAVIVHEGTGASSGHYYSYVRKGVGTGDWFCCDDSFVVVVSEGEVKERLFTSMKTKRTAYLLFYTNAREAG